MGFFTKREVKPGEELSFDYKYERYGNIAQKCYCGTARCRGWLGGEPSTDSGIDEMEEWSTSEEEEEVEVKVKEEERKKKKRRKPKKVKPFEEDEYEDEIEFMAVSGIRNKIQTVQLCRLMVRATRLTTRYCTVLYCTVLYCTVIKRPFNFPILFPLTHCSLSRLRLTDLLLEADQPCLRLFLDYQGLRILSHWMFELEWSHEELELKLRVEIALARSVPVCSFKHCFG